MDVKYGDIQIIEIPISRADARMIGSPWYQELVKGVVDIERGIIALGGEYHMDANTVLLTHGSRQHSVWGFNVYPDRAGEDWIEYVSLINIRPGFGNRGMLVEDPALREAMREHIERLII